MNLWRRIAVLLRRVAKSLVDCAQVGREKQERPEPGARGRFLYVAKWLYFLEPPVAVFGLWFRMFAL